MWRERLIMWRELVSRLFDDARFRSPATAHELQEVESALGLTLPADLRSLLLESNGVAADYSAPLVWSAAEMIEQNLLFRRNPEFRELYMPFDALLFFGAEGNGDQFAYRILDGQIRDPRSTGGTTSPTIGSGSPTTSWITSRGPFPASSRPSSSYSRFFGSTSLNVAYSSTS